MTRVQGRNAEELLKEVWKESGGEFREGQLLLCGSRTVLRRRMALNLLSDHGLDVLA